MALPLIREFLGARLDNQSAPASWTQIFASPADGRDGVLFHVSSGTLQVLDNDTETTPWYSISAGSTFLVPYPATTRVFVKGTGTYKAQQVKVRA